MSEIPTWIQTLQALATPTIALGVGTIAFLQWRTAHQKTVMDLFDRRFQAYEDLMNVAAAFIRKRKLDANERSQLNHVFRRSAFLFGEDAFGRINDFFTAVDGSEYMQNFEPVDDEITAGLAVENRVRMRAVYDFVKDAPIFLEPYMRMKQKQISTPSEWLSAANRRRLSYSDDKQK